DRAQGGLGLGLSLVRTLTELHGGTVTAHSDGPGLGSEFAVSLPASEGDGGLSAPRADAQAAVREPGAGPTRVLIVDDHRDVLESLARLLDLIGYDVRTASDSHSAVELAEAFRPQVAILDIGLPVMDGHALARELRSRLNDAPPVLVALTGYS